jgi:death-on-curing protein
VARLFRKKAALMESLAQNHPFVDANKRTAITAASLFLVQNNYRLIATNEELEQYTLLLFKEHPSLDETAAWFHSHTIFAE